MIFGLLLFLKTIYFFRLGLSFRETINNIRTIIIFENDIFFRFAPVTFDFFFQRHSPKIIYCLKLKQKPISISKFGKIVTDEQHSYYTDIEPDISLKQNLDFLTLT